MTTEQIQFAQDKAKELGAHEAKFNRSGKASDCPEFNRLLKDFISNCANVKELLFAPQFIYFFYQGYNEQLKKEADSLLEITFLELNLFVQK